MFVDEFEVVFHLFLTNTVDSMDSFALVTGGSFSCSASTWLFADSFWSGLDPCK